MVLADPSQIHQVGMNIITNAYHAVESKGGQISIVLKQTLLETPESLQINVGPGTYAILSISDTGHGMPEERIAKFSTHILRQRNREKEPAWAWQWSMAL